MANRLNVNVETTVAMKLSTRFYDFVSVLVINNLSFVEFTEYLFIILIEN